MASPVYARRFARLPQILGLLARHPEGMSMVDLAALMDIPVDELREDIVSYYRADIGPHQLFGLTRPAVISFLAADGSDGDPRSAEWLRVDDPRPTAELGVEYISADQLAPLYEAARMLLEVEPNDPDLSGALAVLAEAVTAGMASEDAGTPERVLETVRAAVEHRRAVEISYSRVWQPGVSTRVIHPYRLTHTHRGWEIDAGPLDARGDVRTFVLANVRDLTELADTFERPVGVETVIDASRATHSVDVVLPVDKRWVADRFAERVETLQHDDESVKLRLDVLEPLADRVGLLLLTAGPDAFVLEPSAMRGTGRDLATRLLAHHHGAPEAQRD